MIRYIDTLGLNLSYLLPGHIQSLVLLLIQLLNGLKDLGLVILHNSLLFLKVVVLKGAKKKQVSHKTTILKAKFPS